MYANALGRTAPPSVLGIGAGAPPKMPDQLPTPTGVGAVPTGDPGSTPKEIADQAIIKLRAAATAFPSLASQLNGCADALVAASRAQAGPPPAGLGQPTPTPGTPLPEVPPTSLSGTVGA